LKLTRVNGRGGTTGCQVILSKIMWGTFTQSGMHRAWFAASCRLQKIVTVLLTSMAARSARATVPILWDKARGTIVSNDSADIVRMLNSAFDGVGAAHLDLYPKAMRLEIDALNARIFASVNAGVYRAGFADDQATYEAAVVSLFDSLAWLDARLSASRYLCGEDLTEADVLLWPTLIRFDCMVVVE
jgi:glutathionyl-hydroquinone reductase